MNVRRLKTPVIAAVALHSSVLGLAMLFRTSWTLDLFGWEHHDSIFFPAQAGVFLLLLSGAYWAGIWMRPFAWFIVISKTVAVTFLITMWTLGIGQNMLLLAALFDGLMGVAVATLLTISSQQSDQPPT